MKLAQIQPSVGHELDARLFGKLMRGEALSSSDVSQLKKRTKFVKGNIAVVELDESWVDKFNEIYQAIKNDTLQTFITKLKTKNILLKLIPIKGNNFGSARTHSHPQNKNILIIVVEVPTSLKYNDVLSNIPKTFFNILRHELAHARQKRDDIFFHKQLDYTLPPDAEKETYFSFKLLKYLVQPIERGPISLDIAEELIEISKTPDTLITFINITVKSLDALSHESLYNIVMSFTNDESLKLSMFLYHYLKLKHLLLTGKGDKDLKKLNAQANVLLKLIKNNYNKIKSYYKQI